MILFSSISSSSRGFYSPSLLLRRPFTALNKAGFHTSSVLSISNGYKPGFGLTRHSIYSQIDWSQIDAGKYAIVDPMTGHSLLYLSPREYAKQIRTALSSESTLVVLAAPGDTEWTNGTESDSGSDGSPSIPPFFNGSAD